MLTSQYLRNLTTQDLKSEFEDYKKRWVILEEKQRKMGARLEYEAYRAPRKNRRSKGKKFGKELKEIRKEIDDLDLERLLFEDEFKLRKFKWSNFWLNNTKGKTLGSRK